MILLMTITEYPISDSIEYLIYHNLSISDLKEDLVVGLSNAFLKWQVSSYLIYCCYYVVA